MQTHDWNDLKYFLALYRTGTLKNAGLSIGSSDTTVARRVKSLERKLGASLFLRSSSGRFEPTDAALKIAPHAEAIELQNFSISEKSGELERRVSGTVRISSVPAIVNHILVPNLNTLVRKHPHLNVELVSASDNVDLSKREADLAIRFARPDVGGLKIKAQKLGTLSFGAYSAKVEPGPDSDQLTWITYDDLHSELPQAKWMDTKIKSGSITKSAIRVSDVSIALSAVANNLGKSLLPNLIAKSDNRLTLLPMHDAEKLPIREVWLLAHVDQSARASVAATKEWLTAIEWS